MQWCVYKLVGRLLPVWQVTKPHTVEHTRAVTGVCMFFNLYQWLLTWGLRASRGATEVKRKKHLTIKVFVIIGK